MRPRTTAVLVLVVVLASMAAWNPSEALACVQLAPTLTFVGTAESRDGDVVVFRVEHPVPVTDDVAALKPDVRVRVRYRSESGLIDLGRSYLVPAWANRNDLESSVAQDANVGDCSLANGTRNADGSFIEQPHVVAELLEAVAALAAIVGLAVMVRWVRRRRRRRVDPAAGQGAALS